MENFGRQLERQGQFTVLQHKIERTLGLSPLVRFRLTIPTLPVRPQVAASMSADVRTPESLSLQSLFHGELKDEVLQNGFVLLAAIRREIASCSDVSLLHSLLTDAATNWIIRAQYHSNSQRQLEFQLSQAHAALSLAQAQGAKATADAEQIIDPTFA